MSYGASLAGTAPRMSTGWASAVHPGDREGQVGREGDPSGVGYEERRREARKGPGQDDERDAGEVQEDRLPAGQGQAMLDEEQPAPSHVQRGVQEEDRRQERQARLGRGRVPEDQGRGGRKDEDG